MMWKSGVPTENGLYVFQIRNHNIGEIYCSLVEKRANGWHFKDIHPRWVLPECEILGWFKIQRCNAKHGVSANFMLTQDELKEYGG